MASVVHKESINLGSGAILSKVGIRQYVVIQKIDCMRQYSYILRITVNKSLLYNP